MGSSPKYEAPDVGKDTREYLEALSDPSLQRQLFQARETYDPKYAQLEFENIRNVLLGPEAGEVVNPEIAYYDQRISELEDTLAQTSDENFFSKMEGLFAGFVGAKSAQDVTRADVEARIAELRSERAGLDATITQRGGGLFDLLGEASSRAFTQQQEQLGLQREADVAALLKFAPQIVEGYRGADPYSAGTADLQREMAQDLYAKSKGLTGQEERMAQQQARAASASRGLQFGQGSLAAELLGREDVLARKRQEAQKAGQVAFGMDRTIAGDLGSVILGRPSSAMGLGSQMLGQATGLAPGMGSGNIFDLGAGVNYSLASTAQQNQFNADVYGAKMGMIGGIAGGALGGLGAAAGGAGGFGKLFCWVAREVYGERDERWLLFRTWLLTVSPGWFCRLYMKHGERFAEWVSDKPVIKLVIRKWMDTRIKQLEKGFELCHR
jgi:hypothetical protein